MRDKLHGFHAALMTPYDRDGEISIRCLHSLVHHIRQQGVEGLYVGGSTGESLLQSTPERVRILAEVAEAAPDMPRIGHVGAISSREAMSLAKSCAQFGYAAVSAIPPLYYPHRKDAIVEYYKDILDAASGVPLIVYNIPSMSGVRFDIDDLFELLSLPGVIGIKHTSTDLYQMEQISREFPEAVLLNGFDEILLPGLAAGATGAVGSTFNVVGAIYVELRRLVADGDFKGARAAQSKANALIDLLVGVGVFPGLKFILYRLGVIETPYCRKPLATLSNDTSWALNAVIAGLKAQAH